jgi:hypothetical protein
MATEAEVKARIEVLADAAVTTLLSGTEQRIARSTLPAIEVRVRGATRTHTTPQQERVRREYELWLFVAEVVKSDDPADVNAALEACYPYLNSIPDYFYQRPRLEDANGVNALVDDTEPMTDSGAATTPYKNSEYAAVRFTLPVLTTRPFYT